MPQAFLIIAWPRPGICLNYIDGSFSVVGHSNSQISKKYGSCRVTIPCIRDDKDIFRSLFSPNEQLFPFHTLKVDIRFNGSVAEIYCFSDRLAGNADFGACRGVAGYRGIACAVTDVGILPSTDFRQSPDASPQELRPPVDAERNLRISKLVQPARVASKTATQQLPGKREIFLAHRYHDYPMRIPESAQRAPVADQPSDSA